MSLTISTQQATKVTYIYRRFDSAHFNHDYHENAHTNLIFELMEFLGLMRVETERATGAAEPKNGDLIATSHTYFASLTEAKSAFAEAGPALEADMSKFTNIKPDVQFSEVQVFENDLD